MIFDVVHRNEYYLQREIVLFILLQSLYFLLFVALAMISIQDAAGIGMLRADLFVCPPQQDRFQLFMSITVGASHIETSLIKLRKSPLCQFAVAITDTLSAQKKKWVVSAHGFRGASLWSVGSVAFICACDKPPHHGRSHGVRGRNFL